jgi:predicted dehydrogenase
MSSSKFGVGIIGFGNRSGLAENAHQPQNGIEITGVADVYPQALEEAKKKYGNSLFVTTNYHELLARKDIQAVFVLSPDFLHEEQAVAALEAGKAVYLEKPMAITIEGCDRILKTAFAKKGKVYVGHNMRHMTFVQKMKEIIDAGKIGEVKAGWCRHFISYGGDAYFKDWHAEQKKGTGLLLQKGAHDIDVLHWLCGGYTQRVNAMGALTLYGEIKDRRDPKSHDHAVFNVDNWPPLSQKQLNPVIDVEDLNMMLMKLDNGVFASYQQCHYTADAWRNYTIIGTEGRLENIGDCPGQCVIRVWNKRNDSYNVFGDEQYFIPEIRGTHGGADPKIVQEFIDYVRNNSKIITSPIAARYSVAAGCMATESLRNGGSPMDIPQLPSEMIAYFNESVKSL